MASAISRTNDQPKACESCPAFAPFPEGRPLYVIRATKTDQRRISCSRAPPNPVPFAKDAVRGMPIQSLSLRATAWSQSQLCTLFGSTTLGTLVRPRSRDSTTSQMSSSIPLICSYDARASLHKQSSGAFETLDRFCSVCGLCL